MSVTGMTTGLASTTAWELSARSQSRGPAESSVSGEVPSLTCQWGGTAEDVARRPSECQNEQDNGNGSPRKHLSRRPRASAPWPHLPLLWEGLAASAALAPGGGGSRRTPVYRR